MIRFMPSNGTDGMIFIGDFCSHCIHEQFMNTQKDGDKQCEIFNNSLLNDRPCFDRDLKYDGWEWFTNEDFTEYKCNQFKHWDWDNDGDPDNPDNPKLPTPVDPNQLTMPFFDETVEKILTQEEIKEEIYQLTRWR